MRIVIASPPRSGNHWIKCLLSRVYDLKWLTKNTPSTKASGFEEWVTSGGFPDGRIFFMHCRFSKGLCDVIDDVPAHLVTIVRDPYDVFVSLYYWTQERAVREHGRQKARKRDALIGKPLDHPDVLAYLAKDFRSNIVRAHEWLHSGRAVVVRYEGLHRDPVGELARATGQIRPVEHARINAAIEVCHVDNMRQMKEKFTW